MNIARSDHCSRHRSILYTSLCPYRLLRRFWTVSPKRSNHIGLSPAALVLQGYEEAACMRRVVAVVPARPGVDVKNSTRRDYHVAGVTNVVSEDRCAKTRGNCNPLSSFGHAWLLGFCSRVGLVLRPAPMICPCTLRRARRGQTAEF